jgi:ankyrin repeat protein
MTVNPDDLVKAIRANDPAAVAELLDSDSQLTAMESPLQVSFFMMSLYVGSPEAAAVFLRRGYNLNLHEASAWGDVETVQHLLEKDPDLLNSYSVDGFQALGLACFFNQEKVVEVLLNAGARVNDASHNFQQVSPLHSAAAADNPRLCRMLIDRGAEVNARQQGGFTPLHTAAQNGNLEMVKLFLSRGAEMNALTSQGRTPLSLAKESKNDELIRLLQSAGGMEQV